MIDPNLAPMCQIGGRLAKIAYPPEVSSGAAQSVVQEANAVAAGVDALGLSLHGFWSIGDTDTEFYIARDVHTHTTYIGVRGTTSLRDLRIDAMALRRRIIVQDTPILVHAGCYRSLLNIGGIISAHLDRFPSDEIWMAGHSLGGGITSLARALLPWIWRDILRRAAPVINCIRVASMRAGCPEFARYSDSLPGVDIRIEHEDADGNTVDPVCGMPGSITKRMGPIERYRHAGTRLGLYTDLRGFAAHPLDAYNDSLMEYTASVRNGRAV